MFEHGTLMIQDCLSFTQFAAFEAWLRTPGPWVAACDFPFGLPSVLLQRLGWPQEWAEYVAKVKTLGKEGFEEMLRDYRAGRPIGDKLHYRVTDRLAGAISPMMMVRVPVGKMFFEGAPRLLEAGVSVLPCQPKADERIVLEGYPVLVARRWLGKRGYKSDERKKQTVEQRLARHELLKTLCSSALMAHYGFMLSLSHELMQRLIDEPMGDELDALCCAIQAAWAYSEREHNYSIPAGHEREGWIVDPALSSIEIQV
jgi:hypothetical protein